MKIGAIKQSNINLYLNIFFNSFGKKNIDSIFMVVSWKKYNAWWILILLKKFVWMDGHYTIITNVLLNLNNLVGSWLKVCFMPEIGVSYKMVDCLMVKFISKIGVSVLPVGLNSLSNPYCLLVLLPNTLKTNILECEQSCNKWA